MAHRYRNFGLIGLLIMTGVSDVVAQPKSWNPALMMEVKRFGCVQISPASRYVAFTVRTAVMEDDKSEYLTHIYLSNDSGSSLLQLTQGDKSCDDPQWMPGSDSAIAFVSARSGTKNLWVINAHGGEARQITDVKGDVSAFKWSPTGEFIAFAALDEESSEQIARKSSKNDAQVVDEQIRRQRLYVIPVGNPGNPPAKARLLTPGDLSIGGDTPRPGRPPFDWSPQGDKIVFSHTATPRPEDWTTANLSIVDVAKGEIQSLTKTAASESAPFYSPDGKTIAYVAGDDPPTWAGRKKLCVIAVVDGTPRADLPHRTTSVAIRSCSAGRMTETNCTTPRCREHRSH